MTDPLAQLRRDLSVAKDPHSSPSQVSTWRGCQRCHAYSRVRPRKPGGPAQVFGTKTHNILEHWIKHNRPPDAATREGRTAMAGLHFLPMPGHGLTEYEARPIILGVPWIMRIDLLWGYVPGEQIVVTDYKTTGDYKHMKTPEQLAEDPQRISYAYWAVTTLGLRGCWCYWVYFNRNDETARHVVFYEDRETLIARFEAMHAYDNEPMIAAAIRRQQMNDDEAWIQSLPRDETFDHCSKFGGCDYREECHATIDPIKLATRFMAHHNRQEQGR